jgi:DNA-binding MarR family transcriptional regulator
MGGQTLKRRETAVRVWDQMRKLVATDDSLVQLRKRLWLGPGRVMVIRLLKDGPLSLGEIAERHGVDAPYATIIVDKLESHNLVERRTCAEDRRRKLVSLTGEGREALKVIEEELENPPAVLSRLSMQELEQLDALLSKIE